MVPCSTKPHSPCCGGDSCWSQSFVSMPPLQLEGLESSWMETRFWSKCRMQFYLKENVISNLVDVKCCHQSSWCCRFFYALWSLADCWWETLVSIRIHFSSLKVTDDNGLEGAEETVTAFTSSIIAKPFSSDFTSANTYQCSYIARSNN